MPGDANTPTRTTTYEYAANGVDLTAVYQENPSGTSTDGYGNPADLLCSITYSPQGNHLPLTVTDTAAQTTTYAYNSYGQPLTITNARNEKTKFAYDHDAGSQLPDGTEVTDGKLLTVTAPAVNATTTFGYDSFDRVSQVMDSEGYTVGIGYDATGGDATKTLNRLATRTYPDGTWEQIDYDRMDPGWTRDRLGRWTQLLHDQTRHVVGVYDPAGRFTQYDWCSCGSLAGIIDAAGNRTTWMRDTQSRVTEKIYPDNTVWSTTYENSTSRVKLTTDAKGQRTNYLYNVDDSLKQISYTDANGNALVPPTPTVTYAYDPVYPRLSNSSVYRTSTPETTSYTYNPVPSAPPNNAGRLASVDGPFANDTLTYRYDELGRVSGQTIDDGTNAPGFASGVNATAFGYDALGRVHTVTNPLGAFTYNYVNNTGRLDNVAYPNGQRTQYDYFNGTNDPRLKTILNVTNGGNAISQFDYTYNAVGNILTWRQNNPGLANAQQYGFGYDAIDELTSATLQDTVTGGVVRAQAYRYDAAMNRTSAQDGNNVTTETPNQLNQLTGTVVGGLMRFAGTVSKPATVTVGGNAAMVKADGSYEGWAAVASNGTTRVHIVATDSSGQVTDRFVDVPASTGTGSNFGYDLNGNQQVAGQPGSLTGYGWDAADRLVSITQGGHTTRFDYDGQGRRVRESLDGVESKRWVWSGLSVAEERDGSNHVTKRFYGQGEQIAGKRNVELSITHKYDADLRS